MEQVYIEDIASAEGKEVEIKGWLYNARSSGKLRFLQIRDGTGIIQAVVFKEDVSEEVFSMLGELTQETSIILRGTIHADMRAPGGYEMSAFNIEKVGDSPNYPITPKEHGVHFLLDRRHLWMRSAKQHAILRVRHEVVSAIRDFFNNRGFINLDAPIFTPAACEETSTLFETEYFNDQAYLTQSGQLYMEAGCMAFGKVYCFGPTFRAEKSKTRKHLTEFWMVEPEVAYMNLQGDMELAEDFICYIIERALENRRPELDKLERDISKLEAVKKPFPRITYDEAVKILQEKGSEIKYGDDLGAVEEEILGDYYHIPVMIHHWPAEVKAFYMKRDADKPELALGVDMIAPEGYGEIIGGGQREDDYDTLLASIKKHNLPEEAFDWYLDLRRYGSVPHAGFGLGLERTVGWITGVHHIRECIPLPRMMQRLKP
ncbi:MAG: asparagine--tRNA ligase [candidate division Zixibacteria bacterium]|nr:asparagine--tRNA ligase [Candidatus Tariuqbacter arcticus]